MTPHKVLIVEDELIVQMHLQRIVMAAGHQVTATTTTGRGALRAADRDAPDLVLMDINLPGDLDGVDAARALRDKHDCSVVFATAYADAETLDRTRDVAAAGYIVKPFSDAEVRAAITTALNGREGVRQARERERSLTSILERIGEGLFVTDERGTISFANAQAARLSGWNAKEASGRHVGEVLRFSADADARAFREALRVCLAEARPESLSRVEIVSRGGGEHVVAVAIEPLSEEGRNASGAIVQLRGRARLGERLVTVRPAARRSFGPGTRLLVYSHDTFGLGHLQRCRNLVSTLLRRHPEVSVLLVTGSSVVHRYDLPSGADYVKLPTVRKVGAERYEARSLQMSESGIRELRSDLLLRTVRDYDPDVLLVDHAPIGMRGEMLPSLEWLSRNGGCTRILGLRDIIDDPRSVIQLWREQRIHDVLRELYDEVCVYGSQRIYDTVAVYEFPCDVAARTRFLNYVCEPSGPEAPFPPATVNDAPLVAVTIGGGDGAAETIIDPFLEMLRRYRAEVDFRSEILTGPLLPPDVEQRLREEARGLPVALRSFVTSTTPLLRNADLVVATAGYNTTTQLLAHARRAVVIPRVLHRDEQLIRARLMQELGLMICMHPDQVEPQRLLAAIRAALRSSDEPLTRGRADGVVPLDGAERFAEFCGRLFVGRSADPRRSDG